MHISEDEMIRKAGAGDVDAFGLIVDKYKHKIFGAVFALSGDRDEAEEVSQRVFIKLWKNIKKFRFESAFSTWVYRVSHNTFLNYIREKKRYADRISGLSDDVKPDVNVNDENRDISDEIEKSQIRDKVISALKRIPEEFAAVVIYYDIEGLSYAEISEIIGIPEGTVKSRIFRGRKMLKEEIGNISGAAGV